MKDINAVIVETQEISLQKGDWWLAVELAHWSNTQQWFITYDSKAMSQHQSSIFSSAQLYLLDADWLTNSSSHVTSHFLTHAS